MCRPSEGLLAVSRLVPSASALGYVVPSPTGLMAPQNELLCRGLVAGGGYCVAEAAGHFADAIGLAQEDGFGGDQVLACG